MKNKELKANMHAILDELDKYPDNMDCFVGIRAEHVTYINEPCVINARVHRDVVEPEYCGAETEEEPEVHKILELIIVK